MKKNQRVSACTPARDENAIVGARRGALGRIELAPKPETSGTSHCVAQEYGSHDRVRLRRRLEPGTVHAREPAGGVVEFRPAAGGLAPSLSGALAEEPMGSGSGVLWVASAFTEADRLYASAGAVATGQDTLKLRMVAVTPEIGRAAYDVIANGTLWFLHHGLFDHARRPCFDRVWHEAWEGYCQFNEAIADAVAEQAATGATVVVNDYHLALVGRYLAKSRPDLATAFFTHTAFCPPEDLAMVPDGPRLELMESMSCFGACGFHTSRWRDAFVRCASAVGVEAPATFVAPSAPTRRGSTRWRPPWPADHVSSASKPSSTAARCCCAATASNSRRT